MRQANVSRLEFRRREFEEVQYGVFLFGAALIFLLAQDLGKIRRQSLPAATVKVNDGLFGGLASVLAADSPSSGQEYVAAESARRNRPMVARRRSES